MESPTKALINSGEPRKQTPKFIWKRSRNDPIYLAWSPQNSGKDGPMYLCKLGSGTQFQCVCVEASLHQQAMLTYQQVPKTSTQLWHFLPTDRIRLYRWRVQCHKTPFQFRCQSQTQVTCDSEQLAANGRFQQPPPTPIPSASCDLCFRPVGYVRASYNPFYGFN